MTSLAEVHKQGQLSANRVMEFLSNLLACYREEGQAGPFPKEKPKKKDSERSWPHILPAAL